MALKIIRSKKDYAAALQRFEQVFQAKMYTAAGATPPWGDFYQTGYVVDKGDWDYFKDQYSLPYRTILSHNGDLGFPLDPVNANVHLKGTVGNRLYVYLGANFDGARPLPAMFRA